MEDLYDELPDDEFLAFKMLHKEFRRQLDAALEQQDESQEGWDAVAALRYMNQTLAAARSCNIEELLSFRADPDLTTNRTYSDYIAFEHAVEAVEIQRSIAGARRHKELSVGLTAAQKAKIHSLLEKVRKEVEVSSAPVAKKEKLFTIIAKLQAEVDKQRTGLERFGDLARGLAGISKDVAEEGVKPWVKLYLSVMGIVDDAKEAEPQLPKPPEVKRIEPPKPSTDAAPSVDDDEIPF